MDMGEAEKLLREVMGHLDAANTGHRDLLIGANLGLGATLTKLGRPAEGLPLLEQAVAMGRVRYEAGDWRMAETQLALGLCLNALQQTARADPLLREAAEKLRRYRKAQPVLTSQAERAVAQLREGISKPSR